MRIAPDKFAEHIVWPEGIITLLLILVDYNNGRNGTRAIMFVVINTSSLYDVIFRRLEMHKFRVIASTIDGVVKFYTMLGVGTIPTKKKAGRAKQDLNQDIINGDSRDIQCSPNLATGQEIKLIMQDGRKEEGKNWEARSRIQKESLS